jgi:hypothetical protein
MAASAIPRREPQGRASFGCAQYNSDVPRVPLCLLFLALFLAGCQRAPESKEAVRSAVMDHLAKNTGLDIGSMAIEVGNVKFSGDTAQAAVSFRPKSSPDAGMTMSYSLERRGAKWVVAKRPEGSSHGGQAQDSTPRQGGELPPGHPPLSDRGAAKK